MSTAHATRRPARQRSLIAAASAAALISAAFLAGCQSPDQTDRDTTAGGNTSKAQPGSVGLVTDSSGVPIVHDDWARLGYRWEWSATPFTAGRARVEMLDILGGVVAVQSVDSWTALLQAGTGSTLWLVRNTSPLTSFVDNVRVNDVLLSCGRPELFLMEISSGNLLARQPVDVVVSTAPVIHGGLAVFGTPTGQVLCHRFGTQDGEPLAPPFEDGIKEWGYLLSGSITAAPVKIGATAGFVTQTGEVFFVDIPTGSGLGRAHISGGMATDPVTDETLMYAASLDQSVYAFDPNGSTYLWRYRTDSPLRTQPTCHAGVLYVHVPSEGLIAFDISEDTRNAGGLGQVLWKNPQIAGEVVAVRGGGLVVWDGSAATLVDSQTGDRIASARLPRIIDLVPSRLEDGDLYAVSDNGVIIKFSPR